MTGALKVRTSTSPDMWTTIGGGSFATDAETVAGVVDDRAVTPAGLNAALDEAVPELASDAETIIGTSTVKAVSPAGLKAATPYVDVREYGAVGDGTVDDTAALQAWATYITANHKVGWLPNGTYKITAPIVFPTVTGWSVIGEDRSHTTVRQFTDNVAVFQFGDTLGSQIFHSIVFRNVRLDYNTPQPAANTAAIALRLYTMMYYSEITMLQFTNCAWGIKATGESGEFGPWGNTWDDLAFSGLGIGAISFASASSGIPNNAWGRMTINCAGSPAGPIIQYKGYNTTFQAVEFLYATNQQLFTLTAAGGVTINQLKIENAVYTSAPLAIFDFSANSEVQIGSVWVGGTTATFNPASSYLSLIRIGSGGGNGFLEVGHLRLAATSLSGNVIAVECGTSPRAIIGDADLLNGWTLQYTGGTVTSNLVSVRSWANGQMSDNLGDADKTITVRDPTVNLYTTAFTAPRTFTLPAKAGNNLFSGLTYRIVVNGAVNGANTLIIKEGANTLRTQSVDKVVIDYTWKRISGGQWVMTGYQTLP